MPNAILLTLAALSKTNPPERKPLVAPDVNFGRELLMAPALSGVGGDGLGPAWGRAVHRGLEVLGRGRVGASLDGSLVAIARDAGPDEAGQANLKQIVAQVGSSDGRCQLQVGGQDVVELPVMRATSEGGVTRISEGVVDAAVASAAGWMVVDWKTNDVGEAEWGHRERAYRTQAESYVAILYASSGRAATTPSHRVRLEGPR